ncbi:MAG: CPBP family intramembrane glutamic endopeptidase [Maricaulaceae bacterium]
MKTQVLDKSALLDLAIVLFVLVSIKQLMIPITVVYAGPISTFSAMIVATFLLKRRDANWKNLGLKMPVSWPKTLGLTLFTLIAFFGTVAIFNTVADHFFEDIGTSGRFDHIEGNPVAYLIIMLLVWTHGSTFEELLFRAFVITKTSLFLGGNRLTDVVAVMLAAIFFGYRHYYYQGLNGAVVTGGIGLTFGFFYIWFGRKNILPLILAHGLINSFVQTMRFLGYEV